MSRHRGVVLRLSDAAAIHRWLEFVFKDRRFDNPIVASEVRCGAREAMDRLELKLIAQFAEDDNG